MATNARADGPTFRVPEGFVVEKVAGAPTIHFPMFAAFDERGRLFVTESSGGDLYDELQKQTRHCRISLLPEPDERGVFTKSTVFQDNLVFPMGLAWRDGKLYTGDPPDLITLTDTDGDGRADKREVVLTGFGHTDNGSLHGLTFGPDGWLYMTTGNPDGYKLKRDDGTFLTGESGALLRCRPDGSGVEMLSRGFENLVEVIFTPSGEIIGTDTWFFQPSGGVRDALVHLVDGGLYPLHLRDKGTPHLSGPPLPPISTYPAVAHSGMVRYEGTAFPEPYRENLFTAQHNTRKVVRHKLVRVGSTYKTEDADFLTTDDPDFHPSDVLEDADGSLLIVDTGSWYIHHCPTGRIRHSPAEGGIYRVRFAGAPMIEDPRGLKLDWKDASAVELAARLSDPRPAVRDRASDTLVARGSDGSVVPALASLLETEKLPSVKQQALWALCRIAGDASLAALRSALKRQGPELLPTVARALAVRSDRASGPELAGLLNNPSSLATLRMAAAEALARCGGAEQVPALAEALRSNPDGFLEHALINALYQIAPDDDLAKLLGDPAPRAQSAALLLLDQPPREKLSADAVVARVFAADPGLRATALTLLQKHRDWANAAADVAARLVKDSPANAETNAALPELVRAFPQDEAIGRVVETVLNRGDSAGDATLKVSLLAALSVADPSHLPETSVRAIRAGLMDAEAAVRAEAVRTTNVLQLAQVDTELTALVADPAAADATRVEALRALARRRPNLTGGEADVLIRQLDSKRPPLERVAAAEVAATATLDADHLAKLISAATADPLIPPGTVLSAVHLSGISEQSAGPLLTYLKSAVGRGLQLTPEDRLWLAQAIPPTQTGLLKDLNAAIAARVARQTELLAKYTPLLAGGDAERGKALFFGKASCSACHRVGDQGGTVGPDLTKVGAIRPGRDILESVVLPSASFAQGYEPFVARLANGDTVAGVRVKGRESEQALVLRDSSGAEIRLDKSKVKKLVQSTVSIMPEGLLDAMKPDEARDLLAYVQGLR